MRLLTLCCLATLALLLASLHSSAQLFLGVEGGPNRNYLTTSNASEPFTNYEGMKGWNIGIPVGYQFFDWLALEATPTYIQKNFDIVRTGFFTGVYQKNNNTYLQLPLNLRFSFGGKELRGFVDLGGYGAYWASGRIKAGLSGDAARVCQGFDKRSRGLQKALLGLPRLPRDDVS